MLFDDDAGISFEFEGAQQFQLVQRGPLPLVNILHKLIVIDDRGSCSSPFALDSFSALSSFPGLSGSSFDVKIHKVIMEVHSRLSILLFK